MIHVFSRPLAFPYPYCVLLSVSVTAGGRVFLGVQ